MKTLDLDTLELKSGSHSPNDTEMCVMEAVAFVAGEKWSDSPAVRIPSDSCIPSALTTIA